MKIIRCTQKLIKELNVEPEENICAGSWLESWHASIFEIDSEQCVLVSNDVTLYTLFFPAVNHNFLQNFQFYFNEHLFKSMLEDGVSQPFIEKVLSVGDEITFTKSANRRVIGSMNDFRKHVEASPLLWDGVQNCPVYAMQKMLNKTPMGMLENLMTPMRAFMQKLEND